MNDTRPANVVAPDDQFTRLLGYLQAARGVDFGAYKRESLKRRIFKRLADLNLDDLETYVDYLEVHPEEFPRLFDSILINVTAFFRDAPAWEALSEQVLPQILNSLNPGGLIRVWTAGCSTGQETYSVAMVLAEILGPSEFIGRVKIYATDLDEDALTTARQGTYSRRELQGVPDDLLARYFEPSENSHTFRSDLRRAIIFGRHNLASDAPISRNQSARLPQYPDVFQCGDPVADPVTLPLCAAGYGGSVPGKGGNAVHTQPFVRGRRSEEPHVCARSAAGSARTAGGSGPGRLAYGRC